MSELIKNQTKQKDDGFTLAEVVISMGIIAITLTLFALMLTSVSSIQGDLDRQRIAERILYGEAEKLAAMRWDNIMPNPNDDSFDTCQLNSAIISTQAVNTGPESITVDNLEVSVTRTIQWHSSGDPVECSDTNKFRAEPKRITINATWNGQNEVKTKSLVLIRSRWAEAPLENEQRGNQGRETSIIYSESFGSSASWCQSYTDTETGTLITPGSATLLNEGISLTFGDNQEGVCGVVLTGLEPGKSYTVSITANVPAGSTEVAIAINGIGEGPLALPGVGAQSLTYSWIETGNSRLVGVSIPEVSNNENGDSVFISRLTVYQNN